MCSKELGVKASLLHGFKCIKGVQNEARLVLEAPNRAARRMFIVGVKDSRAKLKATPYLTSLEKAHKALIYRYA